MTGTKDEAQLDGASKAVATGVKRVSPPQAAQKVREDVYVVQVTLNEPPSADWKRFFYDTQRDVPADFQPRAVEVSGGTLRFRSNVAGVEPRIALIDRWIARANEKEASLPARSEEERRRREEMIREQQELAELNARWMKL